MGNKRAGGRPKSKGVLVAQRIPASTLAKVAEYRTACERQTRLTIRRHDCINALLEIGLETVAKAAVDEEFARAQRKAR